MRLNENLNLKCKLSQVISDQKANLYFDYELKSQPLENIKLKLGHSFILD